MSLAKRVLEQIIETGTVTRGWFGVDVADITPELAESLGLKGTRGAIVGAIERGSPAEKSGMKLGDVIVAVDGREVANTSAALAAIAEIPPGKSVPVRVMRAQPGPVARRAGRQAPPASPRRGVERYSEEASPSAAGAASLRRLSIACPTMMPTS